jgi:hypothetical protein
MRQQTGMQSDAVQRRSEPKASPEAMSRSVPARSVGMGGARDEFVGRASREIAAPTGTHPVCMRSVGEALGPGSV